MIKALKVRRLASFKGFVFPLLTEYLHNLLLLIAILIKLYS